MKITKKKISELNRPYAIAELTFEGAPCVLVAAEGNDPCLLIDGSGRVIGQPWQGPGGVMTMEELPSKDGSFLSTQLFYSPDDASEAKLILAEPAAAAADSMGGRPGADGVSWSLRVLAEVPFIHRFGILSRGGVNYLIVCALKTGCEYDGDWRFPGTVSACVLPEDLSEFGPGHHLPLRVIKSGLLKNHGFCKLQRDGFVSALVTCEEGVFEFVPPAAPEDEWTVARLLDMPVSDARLCDLDGDGLDELCCISPFHGDTVTIHHLNDNGCYEQIWQFAEPVPFSHAIWAGTLAGTPAFVLGHREGKRDTMVITWDASAGSYNTSVIDPGAGAANVLHFVNSEGQDVIIGANRETDEAAMYIISAD